MDPVEKLRHLAKSHDIQLERRRGVLEEVFLFDIEQSSAGDEILGLVGEVPSVQKIHMEDMQASSQGARAVQRLAGLTEFYQLAGGFPLAELSLAKFANLRRVELVRVPISRHDVEDLSKLLQLKEVILQSCSASDSDELLRCLLQCAALRKLKIRDTRAGTAAGCIPECTSLRSLDLGYSGVTDADIQFIGELRKLEALNLDGTAVTSACLRAIHHSSLKVLTIKDAAVSSDAWEDIGKSNRLDWLVLAGNPIDSSGIESVRELKELETLGLSKTLVDDAAVTVLCKLTSLETLFLSDSRVSEEGVRRIVDALGDDVVFRSSDVSMLVKANLHLGMVAASAMRLKPAGAVGFALACIERQWPVYERASAGKPWTSAGLRTALDQAWQWALRNEPRPANLVGQCLPSSPPDDHPSDPSVAAAQLFSRSAVDFLSALQDGEASDCRPAHTSFDLLKMLGDQLDGERDTEWRRLVEREIEKQTQDAEAMINEDHGTTYQCLRESSAGRSLFDDLWFPA